MMFLDQSMNVEQREEGHDNLTDSTIRLSSYLLLKKIDQTKSGLGTVVQ
jgi:hypothetical protein